MKKLLLSLFLSAMFGMTMAQNSDGKAKANAAASTKYVTASDLNALLTTISNRLDAIEAKLENGVIIDDQVDIVGIIPGKFTVNANKKQVQFTHGNLYWNGSAFRLEKSQIATAQGNSESGTTAWNNTYHVSHFFWVSIAQYTSYYNSVKPYDSTYEGSNTSTNDKFWCGEENPITVQDIEGLYTLTGGENGEWNYLINGRSHASDLRQYNVTVTDGTTTSAKCLIIAPDDFDYTKNPLKSSYTLDEVNSLGLVCLPAAGLRNESFLEYGGNQGLYWSSTPGEYNDEAYNVFITENEPNLTYNYSRKFACSIRLVRNAK